MTIAAPGLIRLLLDTSYGIFLIRAQPRLVQVAFEHYRPGEIAVSALTVAALEAFARRSSAVSYTHLTLPTSDLV